MGDLRLDQELQHTSGLLSGIAILLYGVVLVIGLLRGPEPVQRARRAASMGPG